MISKVRIAARVSHGVVIIRLGSQCVVARLGAALAGRVGLGGLQGFPNVASDALSGASTANQIQGLRSVQAFADKATDQNQDGGLLVAASGNNDLIEQGGDLRCD
jgi:hypothetical protein